MRRLFTAILVAACSASCGAPPPPEPKTVEAPPPPKKKSMTWGEFGVVDVKKVDEVFAGLQATLTACQDRGNKFSSGTIHYTMRTDHSGHVKYAFVKISELGDREVEKCMLEVLRKATWPIPEEGDDAMIEKPITFPDREERPPEDWQADQIMPALGKVKGKLQDCRKGHSGMFHATIHVDKSGKVASAGIAAPDDKGEPLIDCMVDVIKKMKCPSPGSWPARVSFEIP
jgi:hypothetical protein